MGVDQVKRRIPVACALQWTTTKVVLDRYLLGNSRPVPILSVAFNH
jgi:hypothetical protein